MEQVSRFFVSPMQQLFFGALECWHFGTVTKPDDEAPRDRASTEADHTRSRQLGRRLRDIFDEVAAEPLPDAFEALLRKLD